MVQAAITATAADAPSASASAAASCDAPANTIVDRPIDTPPPSPVATGVAPATRPNGMTPMSIGATARAPAASSARAVEGGTAASCRGIRRPPTRSCAIAPYAVRRCLAGGDLAKPLLRGWMHLVCFFLAIPAGVTVIALAQSPRGRVGALVYAVGLVALFGVSGSYHRFGWSDARRLWMQKLDHGTIFLMIAGSYTPVCLMVLDGWVRWTMLAVAWTGARGGLRARVHRRAGPAASCAARSTSRSAGRPSPPSRRCGRTCRSPSSCSSRSAACSSPSARCSCFTRWPDPFPRVFGYHEVWHVMVVAAVACHFVAITSVVSG